MRYEHPLERYGEMTRERRRAIPIEKRNADTWIYDHLADLFPGMQTAREIADATAIKLPYVRVVLYKLVAKGKLFRPMRGYYCTADTLRYHHGRLERLAAKNKTAIRWNSKMQPEPVTYTKQKIHNIDSH